MNRRTFELRAADYLSMARRYHDPLMLVLIDLDHYKQINDREGHAGGDRALQRFAQLLASTLRRGDLACRFGGEEFCVLLSRADPAAAGAFDRRLRAALGASESGKPPLSYSAGCTSVRDGELALDDVVKRADEALYRAKDAGRGRLEVARGD
jgi:diguanylate cyclase (GGDEF)-like protein